MRLEVSQLNIEIVRQPWSQIFNFYSLMKSLIYITVGRFITFANVD